MAKNFTPHRIAFYIGIIVVWQVISMGGIWPDNIFPSPYEVAEDLVYSAADGSLFYGIATSMWRLIIGLAIAIGGGIVLGIFMARVEVVNQTVGSLVLGLQKYRSSLYRGCKKHGCKRQSINYSSTDTCSVSIHDFWL